MNAIKSGGGGLQHSHTNHTTQGGTYRLPNTPHDKMGKFLRLKIPFRYLCFVNSS